jgi:hypothetical protein
MSAPRHALVRDRQAELCRCGHERTVHGHYRDGDDCGSCGCPRFRRPGRMSASVLAWAVARWLREPPLQRPDEPHAFVLSPRDWNGCHRCPNPDGHPVHKAGTRRGARA